MAIASYEVVGSGGVWRVKHDGEPVGSYQTKESAFEAAIAAASSAVREGYEVQLSVLSNPNRHREAKRAPGVTSAGDQNDVAHHVRTFAESQVNQARS